MPPFMINEEMHWVQKQMCPKRGRIFWRSFSENVHSSPLCWLKPVRVNDPPLVPMRPNEPAQSGSSSTSGSY